MSYVLRFNDCFVSHSIWLHSSSASLYDLGEAGRSVRIVVHVIFLWVPSHVGIPGNEAADMVAKEALSLPPCDLCFPVCDVLHIVCGFVWHAWQQVWTSLPLSNKLRAIYDLPVCACPVSCTRGEDVSLARLRNRHTCLTHKYLLYGVSPPECDACDTPLALRHILLVCRMYGQDRSTFNLPDDVRRMLALLEYFILFCLLFL
ncbi:hypothetical protein PR048_015267 [Dryococelus australis]|uniref:RNase H type-1 domain-containing protein n=1 Tax=Dryococelus australis TaxID=614101 RepID=A0ABQ9HGH3_9NEOP|nr:hypothetical protein PR048_015267 [Dryococelus australis]